MAKADEMRILVKRHWDEVNKFDQQTRGRVRAKYACIALPTNPFDMCSELLYRAIEEEAACGRRNLDYSCLLSDPESEIIDTLGKEIFVKELKNGLVADQFFVSHITLVRGLNQWQLLVSISW